MHHPYSSEFSLLHRAVRAIWGFIRILLFNPAPRICFGWRRLLLKAFGAKIDKSVRIYPGVKVWAPWNLEMRAGSSLGDDVDCYNVDKVIVCDGCIVSQGVTLCTASHDINDPCRRLITAPIVLGKSSLVFSKAFIFPGITTGEGSVVGAMSVVTRNVGELDVVVGNPARYIKKRSFDNALG